jgi:hypothetical protein
MWISEVGWPTNTGDKGSSFLQQARCLARTYALALGSPDVERVLWYDLKDDGTDPAYTEANFGLLHHENYLLAPKPSYVALAQFVEMTSGRTRGPCERSAEGLWTATYEGADDRVRMVFMDSEGQTASVAVPPGAVVTDLFGRVLDAGAETEVDTNPVYIRVGK